MAPHESAFFQAQHPDRQAQQKSRYQAPFSSVPIRNWTYRCCCKPVSIECNHRDEKSLIVAAHCRSLAYERRPRFTLNMANLQGRLKTGRGQDWLPHYAAVNRMGAPLVITTVCS